MARRKSAVSTTKVKPVEVDVPYKCTRCGVTYQDGDTKFYKIKFSPIYKANNTYAHICMKCANELFEDARIKYGDQEIAVIVCCHYLDLPFYRGLYNSLNLKQTNFTLGHYIRQLNGLQYKNKTFVNSLVEGQLVFENSNNEETAEEKWEVPDKRNKNEVIKIIGYDPFAGYPSKDRKYLFSELLKWLDDDELLEDNYKLTQILQIVNNNNQIRQCDLAISGLDPVKFLDEVKTLNSMKKDLVQNNDKIAKENGISVKNRTDNKAGKSTLTGLMRDMREKDLPEIEANYYNQLVSENSKWAANVSASALKENCYFDENDINDIIDYQREQLTEIQGELSTTQEDLRLMRLKNIECEKDIQALQKKVLDLGGELDD